MHPGELICRSAIHPKYRSNDVFDEISYFNFTRVKSKYPYRTSVTSLDVAGSEENVHIAGRRAAAASNDREDLRVKNNPEYTPQVFHYLGYYSIPSTFTDNVVSDYHTARLHWIPENGLVSHFHIELHLLDAELATTIDRDDLKSDKDVLISMIADVMFGPTLCPEASGNIELRRLQDQSLPIKRRTIELPPLIHNTDQA